MNNGNDLNLHSMTNLLGWLRYCVGALLTVQPRYIERHERDMILYNYANIYGSNVYSSYNPLIDFYIC